MIEVSADIRFLAALTGDVTVLVLVVDADVDVDADAAFAVVGHSLIAMVEYCCWLLELVTESRTCLLNSA